MNHPNNQASQPPLYPSISPPSHQDINPFLPTPPPEDINPFHQTPAPMPPSSSPVTRHFETPPSVSSPQNGRTEELKHTTSDQDVPSSSSGASPSSIPPTPSEEEKSAQWGTHVMGHPAVPTCHPDNKKAALWGAAGTEQAHNPYLQYKPLDKSNNTSPLESMLHVFNSWSSKAESMANNIWHNLKTGTSVSGAAWAKMNVTAKAITGGGFEALYKQTFATYPNEKLYKSFACYLSTSTGPVAGTLYLSNVHTAFCSDRPLSFTAPSGQVTWSYYKIMVPLGNIATINPVVMRENPTEKYIQIVTIDGHDFWFMGFVNYEKASRHLTQSMSTFVASGVAVKPIVAADNDIAYQKPDKADY